MINLLLREIERFHNQLDTAAGVRDFGIKNRSRLTFQTRAIKIVTAVIQRLVIVMIFSDGASVHLAVHQDGHDETSKPKQNRKATAYCLREHCVREV